ncbi:MAG: caspase family protein [Bacteroidota bacterium]
MKISLFSTLAAVFLYPFQLSAQNFPFKTLHNHDDQVLTCAFSPNSKLLVSGAKDQDIVINSITTRRSLLELSEHRENVEASAFGRDGKYVFTGSRGVFVITDVEENKVERKLTNLSGIKEIKTTSNPEIVYLLSGDKVLQLNWKSGVTRVIQSSDAITFDLDKGAKTAFIGSGKIIKVYNLETFQVEKELTGHKGKILSLDYDPVKERLISNSSSDVLLWDLSTGASIPYEYKKSSRVAFNENGESIIIASKNFFTLRELESAKELTMFTGSSSIDYFELSPDGQLIAALVSAAKIKLFDNPWAPEIKKIEEQTKATENILLSSNNASKSSQSPPQDRIAGKEITSSPIKNTTVVSIPKSDVDINIPQTGKSKDLTYALIIGNEDYQSFQLGLTSEVNVDFAENDARVFREYAINTLGIPEQNVLFHINARAVEMHRAIDKLSLLAKNSQGKGEILFYYAGHGFPDEITKEPFLIPVDVSGSDLKFAVKLEEIYSKLSVHPTKSTTFFLDACFSGGARNQGLLAARGVRVKPKEKSLDGKLVVFSASSGDQSSLPYKEKAHGLFTYYLLKKLQETSGNISYGDLSSYLIQQVGINSVLVNSKEQNPQVNVSPDLNGQWQSLEF